MKQALPHFLGVPLALLAICTVLAVPSSTDTLHGDVLGRTGRPDSTSVGTGPTLKGAPRGREVEDHARFYSAADVLTRWAETTFALTAKAHAEHSKRNDPSAACVFDGERCLFNPYSITSPSFPHPETATETLVKSFAGQAATCRNSTERADCHLDPLCDWDGRTGACFLARDLHTAMMDTLMPCADMLYTPLSESCWRQAPNPASSLPCGVTACRLFPKGSGAAPDPDPAASSTSPAAAGTPEDRCMLAEEVRHISVYDVYDMMLARYGAAQGGKLTGGAGAGAGAGGQGEGEGELRRLGFGSCPTAGLHHGMATLCRATERSACTADKRCMVAPILSQEYCALRVEAAVELLLGGSGFTQAVVQTDAACAAASSRDACLAVGLALPKDSRRTAAAAAAARARRTRRL